MDYINPYDLLNLKSDTLSDIDSSTIRRAKKNLLADIELGDSETISYNSIQLTKSSCIKAVDDLDNKDKAEFHYFIFKNPDLNHFLTKGNLNFFKTYKAESIYKLADFVDFISPFFTFQYDKQLALSYKGRKLNDVKQILSVKPITNESHKELCFKGTYTIVKEIENEIVAINNDITNETSQFIEDSFRGLSNLIAEKVDIELLNTLPNYFQSLRNSLAEKIRNIARDINNDPYNNYKPAFEIIEIANNIFTDGLVKQTISKGYYTIKKNYDDILPKPIPARPQPITTSPSIETKEDEEVEDDKIEKETTGYKRNIIATVILFASCGLLIWSIYNTTTRYIILSFYAFSYLSNLYKFFKSPEIYKANSQIDKIFFFTSIIVCTAAYFNNVAANFFLLYHFVGCCFTLFYDLALNKPYNKNKSFAYLVLALIGTYYLYTSQNVLEPQNSESKQEVVEPLTDKQYFEKGQSLFNQSNFSEAIIQYSEAIKLNPNYADAYVDRGASKANLGQFGEAIDDDKKAIELGFRKSIIYSNLGFAYYKFKQTDSAKHYLSIALKIDSSNSNAYRNRAEIKYDANDNKGAATDYTLAIKFNPHASNYFSRGLAYYYLNDYKKAIQDMDKAIELSPNVGQYYFDRGDTKDRMNDFDGACRDWKMAKSKGYDVPEYKLNKCTPQIVEVINGELSGCTSSNKYDRKLDNKLVITVGSKSNVAIKLINISTQKSVRYVYINKNSDYTIRNIPEGRYYLKIAYGNDWTIMQNEPNCSGRFSKDIVLEKGEEILDYNIIHTKKGYQVPSFSLKLDVIVSEERKGTFNTNKINENDFYNE